MEQRTAVRHTANPEYYTGEVLHRGYPSDYEGSYHAHNTLSAVCWRLTLAYCPPLFFTLLVLQLLAMEKNLYRQYRYYNPNH
jgi:hypothetical protein